MLAVIAITVYAMTPFRTYGQKTTRLPATTSSVSAPSSAATVHKTSAAGSHAAG